MYISIIELIVCNRIILGSVGLTANRPELVIIIKNISGEQDKNNVKVGLTANRPELVIIIKNISGEQDKNNVKICFIEKFSV